MNSTVSGSDLELDHCYRGKHYTIPSEQTTDAKVFLVGIDKFKPVRDYPEQYVGKTIQIKMLGFNTKGQIQDIDEVAEFEYVIKGYTIKATHVAALEIKSGGAGLGGIDTVDTSGSNNVTVQWKDTARNGGISRTAFGQWKWNEFIPGDGDSYDVLIYDSTKTLVETHFDIGDVNEYTYTGAQNNTDFGGVETDFYIGIRPTNPRGFVPMVVKKHILIIA